MEANISGETSHFYAPATQKKSLEWDLNDWKWDGDLFVASPLKTLPSDCRNKQYIPLGPTGVGGSSNSSSSCSEETDLQKLNVETEKRRRAVAVDDEHTNDEVGSLTLKLGKHAYPISGTHIDKKEEGNAKKTKLMGSNSNRSICQVENCGADLSNAKDYHRRHKVCEMHAKASNAIVGNVMQRFCQQCSRFHLLQEFDEGKRSCRRRLAGHNRRRRKPHPDSLPGGDSLNDARTSSYLLISLLRILSNLHANSSDQAKDQDLLSHLLRNLGSIAGTFDGKNLSGLLPAANNMQNNGNSVGTYSNAEPALLSNGGPCVTIAQELSRTFRSTSNTNCATAAVDLSMGPIDQSASVTLAVREGSEMMQAVPKLKSANAVSTKNNLFVKAQASKGVKLSNIDLNNIYNDSEDCTEVTENSHKPANLQTGCFGYPSWVLQDSHQSSPPQASGNSDLASSQSPSSSNGDAQSRTDRIVFKLFGKDPSDFPVVLRAQILDWLSHSPSDIESYIRPGCVILTIYLRLGESTWEEVHFYTENGFSIISSKILYSRLHPSLMWLASKAPQKSERQILSPALSCNLGSSLNRLLDMSNDSFWQNGWVYARVQQQIAFIFDGEVVLDTHLLFRSHDHCRISSVTPIAVAVTGRADFIVKGFNLCRSTTRLLCAFEGNYLIQEASHLAEGVNAFKETDELQYLSFSCSLPSVIGRGFVEVEDHGFISGFFPFIVAEEDVCSEIRLLESAIEGTESDKTGEKRIDLVTARNQAIEFLHEMGWLLRRSHLMSCRLGQIDSHDSHTEVFPLLRFRWLMEFSLDHDWCAVVRKLLDVLFEGTVDMGMQSSLELTLTGMGLLHRAVRRNCRPMVEFLLRYVPDRTWDKKGMQHKQRSEKSSDGYLFTPDMPGPAGVTPLHIAASRDDADMVLDALTDDPGKVGIQAWKTACDNSGFAPRDYARLRGYYSYIHLVQRKANKNSDSRQVILDIPSSTQKQGVGSKFGNLTGFEIKKTKGALIKTQCKLCDQQQLAYCRSGRSLLYRPAMLSMVAIAAVCVCVGLLFKGFPPFRWETLKYGSI